jgi:hypothetical protein
MLVMAIIIRDVGISVCGLFVLVQVRNFKNVFTEFREATCFKKDFFIL